MADDFYGRFATIAQSLAAWQGTLYHFFQKFEIMNLQ